jgi:hypothetical protein
MSCELQMELSGGRYASTLLAFILIFACISFSIIWLEEPIFQRALIVAVVCLALWLPDIVPPYVDVRLVGTEIVTCCRWTSSIERRAESAEIALLCVVPFKAFWRVSY